MKEEFCLRVSSRERPSVGGVEWESWWSGVPEGSESLRRKGKIRKGEGIKKNRGSNKRGREYCR